jgi:hypothetical protein
MMNIQEKIEEQKIDVVINFLPENKEAKIFQEAKKKRKILKDYITICDIQAQRLEMAYDEAQKLSPLTAEKFEKIQKTEIAFLDMLSGQFSKLQDMIGSKIFTLILELENEYDESNSLRDKLNKLEKLEYIQDAQWWNKLRTIRNAVSHDYPNDYELLATHFNQLCPCAHELLIYWADLKKKMLKLQ